MSPAAKKTAPAKTPAIEGHVVDQVVIDEVAVWAKAPLNGRLIEFHPPNPAQLMVLRRLSRQLGSEKGQGRQFLLVAQILDAVSALMMSQEDRDWADLEVLEGRADLPELTPLIMAAIGGSDVLEKWQADQGAKKAATRRVRRARS